MNPKWYETIIFFMLGAYLFVRNSFSKLVKHIEKKLRK